MKFLDYVLGKVKNFRVGQWGNFSKYRGFKVGSPPSFKGGGGGTQILVVRLNNIYFLCVFPKLQILFYFTFTLMP